MKKRPPEAYILFFLLFLVSLNALAAGWAMMTEPDGAALQLSVKRLVRSPFPDYFIPGLILFVFNGLLPGFALYGLWKKPRWSWPTAFNIYTDKHWSWTYALFSGVILIIWTTVQMFMIPYFWLQPSFVIVGLLIMVVALLPKVMRFYSTGEQ